jgi:hypothetical protein
MLKASGGAIQHSLEFPCPLGGAIGQSAFRLGPYKFNRIELRGISGKPFHMESWVAIQEVIDWFSSMDESSIP